MGRKEMDHGGLQNVDVRLIDSSTCEMLKTIQKNIIGIFQPIISLSDRTPSFRFEDSIWLIKFA